ncbi:hypothetical protein PIB30_103651, partial [Stylosanthes scabra]|nr:hypothetical protein [Stylosanthes scabra]
SIPKVLISRVSHKPSHVALARAQYSTSAEERDTTVCLVLFEDTSTVPTKKQ